MSPRRGLDPDRALQIRLDGHANFLVHERVALAVQDAVAELRQMADGRDDALAIAAGSHIGGYLGAPGRVTAEQLLAAALLAMAGADPDVVVARADSVRAAASGPPHSAV